MHRFHSAWFPSSLPQVVHLREAECRLRLRCKELELRVGEGELSLKELKLATRRVILDADRRRTQQHQRHQSDIQLLLHKLKGEGRRGARGGGKWWPEVDVVMVVMEGGRGDLTKRLPPPLSQLMSLLIDVSLFFFLHTKSSSQKHCT